jgi:hypothetical protein
MSFSNTILRTSALLPRMKFTTASLSWAQLFESAWKMIHHVFCS